MFEEERRRTFGQTLNLRKILNLLLNLVKSSSHVTGGEGQLIWKNIKNFKY